MITYKGYELDISINSNRLHELGYSSKEINEILKNMQQFISTFGLPKHGDYICLTICDNFLEVDYISITLDTKTITIWLES